jgi:hypothetical protein
VAIGCCEVHDSSALLQRLPNKVMLKFCLRRWICRKGDDVIVVFAGEGLSKSRLVIILLILMSL